MAVKEFQVIRRTVVEQGFRVKAANAAEARAILEAEAKQSKFRNAEWDLDEEDVRDRRVTWVGVAENGTDPKFFIRTTNWEPK